MKMKVSSSASTSIKKKKRNKQWESLRRNQIGKLKQIILSCESVRDPNVDFLSSFKMDIQSDKQR